MRRPAPRRLTLLDGMILVGSAAFGLAATRWIDPEMDWGELFTGVAEDLAWDLNLFHQLLSYLLIGTMPVAAAMTLGVLALRLRKPRPRWRRLVRQPGVVACLAGALSWPIALIFATVRVYGSTILTVSATGAPVPMGWDDGLETFAYFGAMFGGFGVVIAWATLLLVGAWRAEPSGIDRMGRLLGLGWIAMAAMAVFIVARTL